MDRPSLKSTLRVSSDIVTLSAYGAIVSYTEIFTPCLQKLFMMQIDDFQNMIYFRPAKSDAFLQAYRFKPELSNLVTAFHMNVRRLITVAGIEKVPIRSKYKNFRH